VSVGPTLGTASLLTAQGRDLLQVVLTMFAFGVGAALPLLALGWIIATGVSSFQAYARRSRLGRWTLLLDG
jgi:cytochrome c biogenesis protein CcdA